MSRVRCNACQGEYETVGRDGVPYAHVCPPIRGARVKRADGSIADVALDKIQPTDTRIAEIERRRPNARDENPIRGEKPINGITPIVSDGLGVTPAAPLVDDGSGVTVLGPTAPAAAPAVP